jgi:hypothetical protein
MLLVPPKTNHERFLKRIQYFRPLTTTSIVKQRRSNLKLLVLAKLTRSRFEKELQVAIAVEHCYQLIDEAIQDFITKETTGLRLYTDNILHGKMKITDCLFREYLNPLRIDRLLNSMKDSIQSELKNCLGISSVNIAAIQYTSNSTAWISDLINSIEEYKNTLLLAEVATDVGDRTWVNAAGKFGINPALTKLLKKMKPATVAMELVGCKQEALFAYYRRQLEQEMTGIVTNVAHKFKMVMRNKVAQIFYEMYDRTYGRHFAFLEYTVKTCEYPETIKYVFAGGRFNQQAI